MPRAPADCLAVTGDVTSYADIERMRGEIEQRLGPVDVLVANAGGSPVRPGPIEELTEAGWHASIDANLTSTFLLLKAFLPGMKARGVGQHRDDVISGRAATERTLPFRLRGRESGRGVADQRRRRTGRPGRESGSIASPRRPS